MSERKIEYALLFIFQKGEKRPKGVISFEIVVLAY